MTDAPDHTRLRHVLAPAFTRRRVAGPPGRRGPGGRRGARRHGGPRSRGRPGRALRLRGALRRHLRPARPARRRPRTPSAGSVPHGSTCATRARASSTPPPAPGASSSTSSPSERRAPHLPDGLVARMVADHGADFDDVELGGLADGVFLGGYETSASMLSLGTWVLLQHPQAWATLRRGQADEVDRVVEELLRFVCPVQVAFPRIARHDVRIGEQLVRSGDVVVVSLTGAGRDPSRHACPRPLRPPVGACGHPRLRPRPAPLRRRRARPPRAAHRAGRPGPAVPGPLPGLRPGGPPVHRARHRARRRGPARPARVSGRLSRGVSRGPGTPCCWRAAAWASPARSASAAASRRRGSCPPPSPSGRPARAAAAR